MSCCNNIYDLGCRNYCSSVSFGSAPFSGSGYIVATFSSIIHTQPVTLVSGDPIILDLTHFNENASYTFHLENNLGQKVSVEIDDIEYDCFSITTQIRHLAYEVEPQPENTHVLVLTGDGGAVYQSNLLVGVTIQLVFNDNVIRIPSDYTFDINTGTLTFASAIDVDVVIQILYL